MNIGIIGGADGPTSIYVASSTFWILAIKAAAVIAAGIIIYCMIGRKNNG